MRAEAIRSVQSAGAGQRGGRQVDCRPSESRRKEMMATGLIPLLGKGGVRGGLVNILADLQKSIRRLIQPPLAPPFPRRGIAIMLLAAFSLFPTIAVAQQQTKETQPKKQEDARPTPADEKAL